MKITVIGSGCPTCARLHEMVKETVKEDKLKAEIEYIKDISALIERGIMGSPALLIDEKVVMIGMPDKEELKKIIGSAKK